MRVFAALVLFVAVVSSSPTLASTGWTFCVGESNGGKDIWMTSVFNATRERERLEIDFRSYLKGRGVAGAIVQCPAPKDDKTAMVNAQFTAAEFHRKLGDALHEVDAPEFSPRR